MRELVKDRVICLFSSFPPSSFLFHSLHIISTYHSQLEIFKWTNPRRKEKKRRMIILRVKMALWVPGRLDLMSLQSYRFDVKKLQNPYINLFESVIESLHKLVGNLS